ncbi:MAG: hypothetical protein ACHQHO_03235 [Solirubrobacterales bacterium]
MADYADQTLRIADLAVDADVLREKSFERCIIVGPAILVPAECRFISCSFEGDPETLIWEIPPERTRVLGAIRLDRCSFDACQFTRVGLGLAHEAAQEFITALAHTAAQEATSGEPVAK